MAVAQNYLTEPGKRVLDLGSGNGEPLAVFSQYADSVGVEIDDALFAASNRCISALAYQSLRGASGDTERKGLVDRNKITIANFQIRRYKKTDVMKMAC